jgi:dual oxidase maturation factor 1|uniref:Uncharacterized protein n=1 Tax=Panagrolaimus sp. PS1159 TaxID=55785 RepID=A0AC35G7J7_9BILA
MVIGWFDAFRENGAPTWYGENPTPVVMDLQIAAILSLFIIPTLAYLTIFPGIRHYRFISTFTFLLSMSVGAIILVSIHYPSWHSGNVNINSPFKAFNSRRLNATLGVKIGLNYLNITLTNKNSNQFSLFALLSEKDHENNLKYNERFVFSDVNAMEQELENALHRGLPYPILKVIEYLSVDRAGFVWGRRYRLAGYYTFVILWLAFSCWILQMIMLCLVPHWYAKISCVVGVITLVGNLVYFLNTPSNLCIRFPAPHGDLAVLKFSPSWSFYLTLGAGIASLIYGITLWILQAKTNYRFKTMFSAQLDEFCGLRRPISMPKGCPAESPATSTSSSLARSISEYRNSDTLPPISYSIESNKA